MKYQDTAIHYQGDPNFNNNLHNFGTSMITFASTSFINPIHHIVWISIRKIPLFIKILVFCQWTVVFAFMLLMTILATERTVFIISLSFNATAYFMTVFNTIFSPKMNSVVPEIEDDAPNNANPDEMNEEQYQDFLMALASSLAPTNPELNLHRNNIRMNQDNSEQQMNIELRLEDPLPG